VGGGGVCFGGSDIRLLDLAFRKLSGPRIRLRIFVQLILEIAHSFSPLCCFGRPLSFLQSLALCLFFSPVGPHSGAGWPRPRVCFR